MCTAILTALESGYRHLDCAQMYPLFPPHHSYLTNPNPSYGNEDEVGSALKEFLQKTPSVKREDIFITTKVWVHLMESEDVEWSLNKSLKDLGLDYVDCFLIHWPFAAERTEDYEDKEGPDGKVYHLTPHGNKKESRTDISRMLVYHEERAHSQPRAHMARNGKAL